MGAIKKVILSIAAAVVVLVVLLVLFNLFVIMIVGAVIIAILAAIIGVFRRIKRGKYKRGPTRDQEQKTCSKEKPVVDVSYKIKR